MLLPALGLVILTGAMLGPANSAPAIKFKDIEGNKGNTQEYADWVIVFSFADRESSDKLMEWQDRANLAIVKAHPKLRVAHVNFADVRAVPRLLRGVVEPILRSINRRAVKRMEETFRENKLTVNAGTARFHLIADWNGDYLDVFGIDDAAKYRLWIVDKGKVVAAMDADTPDIEKRFVAAMMDLAAPPQ